MAATQLNTLKTQIAAENYHCHQSCVTALEYQDWLSNAVLKQLNRTGANTATSLGATSVMAYTEKKTSVCLCMYTLKKPTSLKHLRFS